MIVRETGDRPAPTLPWLKVSEVTGLRQALHSELGVPTKESGQSKTLCYLPFEQNAQWQSIHFCLSCQPNRKNKKSNLPCPQGGVQLNDTLCLPRCPALRGNFHCSAQGPQVGREEYLLENPSVWWVSTELRNWIAKTVTFPMSCSRHCFVLSLFWKDTRYPDWR